MQRPTLIADVMRSWTWVCLSLVISGCAIGRYDCGRYADEPDWKQFVPAQDLEQKLLVAALEHRDDTQRLNSLSDGLKWYRSESQYMLCIPPKRDHGDSIRAGCFVERYKFYIFQGEPEVFDWESMICT